MKKLLNFINWLFFAFGCCFILITPYCLVEYFKVKPKQPTTQQQLYNQFLEAYKAGRKNGKIRSFMESELQLKADSAIFMSKYLKL